MTPGFVSKTIPDFPNRVQISFVSYFDLLSVAGSHLLDDDNVTKRDKKMVSTKHLDSATVIITCMVIYENVLVLIGEDLEHFVSRDQGFLLLLIRLI